ncbi:MAG: hypothetical protein KatS3mg115_2683 [Candidatus Poribacteria bacterium]|nr:MAG: hypothetical protein KatS3mg115_2683 [Candidatus Poribacteria bacterium]
MRPVRKCNWTYEKYAGPRFLGTFDSWLTIDMGNGEKVPLLAASAPMRLVVSTVERVAATDASVLIVGETGTGKELVARAIHGLSARATGPFVAVNCAALPFDLVESELFGHRRGAFSGALRDHRGLIPGAHGGTLLLDEITEMDPRGQAKLLRVLETKQVRPVGCTDNIPVDVRIIATTNRDLAHAISSGRLRQDLYYRIAAQQIEIPPLRLRPEDIPLLANYYLRTLAVRHGLPSPYLTDEAVNVLLQQPWTGNVRELIHVVERALVSAQGPEIRGSNLVGAVTPTPEKTSADVTCDFVLSSGPSLPRLQEVEKELIRRALVLSQGNKSRAALMLGLSRKALYSKLRKHRLHGWSAE